MRIGRWYLVKWHDAYTTNGTDWRKPKKVDDSPQVIFSAGKLVKKNKHYLTLAATYDTGSEKAALFMSIPVGMIVKVTKIDP